MLVFHVDMDAFFAAIEQRDHPELRGQPIIVGADVRRGVVATASYEARKFGVKSAQPVKIAKELCPDAIIVPGRMDVYVEVSRQIMGILESFSPVVEPLSLDEAFLDMTGTEEIFGTPEAAAKNLMETIHRETELTASVGIASNKFLAKLASDLKKPNGFTRVPEGQEKDFIAPMGIRRLWGVGPKTESKLKDLGLHTIGDVADADIVRLNSALGPNQAAHVHALAHAVDPRPVVPDRRRKSIGSERTFQHDIRTRQEIEDALRPHADEIARTLRKKNLKAKGVRVKLRYTRGFELLTRQRTTGSTDDQEVLMHVARSLLDSLVFDRDIRLVGLSVFDLDDEEAEQLSLFGQKQKRTDLNQVVDSIAEKFKGSIKRGSDLLEED